MKTTQNILCFWIILAGPWRQDCDAFFCSWHRWRKWHSSSSTTTLAASASTREQRASSYKNNGDEVTLDEVSLFYRRDRRYWNDDDDDHNVDIKIRNVTGLADLLQKRHDARRKQRQLQVIQTANNSNNSDTTSMIDAALAVQKIDQQLRDFHQVRVYDYPPIWSPWDSEPPPAFYRRRAQKIQGNLQRRFGTLLGHPYQRVGSSHVANYYVVLDCPLTESEIHNRLRLLTEYRLVQKQVEKANALQFELSLLGVRVNAETLQWTTDPDHVFCSTSSPNDGITASSRDNNNSLAAVSSFSFRSILIESSANDGSGEEKEEEGSVIEHLEEQDQVRIRQLLNLRTNAMANGNHLEAEFLGLELYSTYNITLVADWDGESTNERSKVICPDDEQTSADRSREILATSLDKIAEFQLQTNQRMEAANHVQQLIPPLTVVGCKKDLCSHSSQLVECCYVMSNYSLPLNLLFQQRVSQLIQQRSDKREECKFLEADAIRKELWFTYRVGLNDRLRHFSVGGKFQKNSTIA